MNDEERQKLVYRLRQTAIVRDIIGSEAADAANEIERLQGENDWLRTALRAARIAKQQSGMTGGGEREI